jgi:hypothetical protein
MNTLKHHFLYWLHRFANEFRQLATLRLREENVVGEVMNGLKRNPLLKKVIEEKEAEIAAHGKTSVQTKEE